MFGVVLNSFRGFLILPIFSVLVCPFGFEESLFCRFSNLSDFRSSVFPLIFHVSFSSHALSLFSFFSCRAVC